MREEIRELNLDEFDYELPEELIAQEPTQERDQSRLLHYSRASDAITHKSFTDLPKLLGPSDVLVINDSRVIPARLRGRKEKSGGAVEVLLTQESAQNHWWVMLKPGKRVTPGSIVRLYDHSDEPSEIQFEVLEKNDDGHCHVRFDGTSDILGQLDALGEIPLPPYIAPARDRDYNDKERYQTIYANQQGSVAAPTAGLHFTPELLKSIENQGTEIIRVTLHVGIGTFAPVKVSTISDHQMHFEHYEISEQAATRLNSAKSEGKRVIAVGTTSVRVLESAASRENGTIQAQSSRTNIFIYPPYSFKFVDSLITNFHLPKSSLLMLVSAMAAPNAFSGIETIKTLYAEAISNRYRFFSYGDAMLID